ncbi:MAG: hypothetical protein R2684_17470, partial [Pyrinomonadaceae bacterium]
HQFVGGNTGIVGQVYFPDKDNFAPVIGLAWSPSFDSGIGNWLFGNENETVFRAGYRISYINDELIRAPDNAVGGNQGLRVVANAINPNTNTTALNARIDNLPTIATPAFNPNPTFLQNNLSAGRFGTVFAVDPYLESPLVQEYSFGIQRAMPFDTVLEVRYVGTQSSNLLRGVDFNQVDIRNNGFLDDFNRARANYVLTGNPQCFPAPGCQELTVFPNLVAGGLLNNSTVRGQLLNGIPADLAILYQTNGLAGNVQLLPNPNAGPVDVVINGSYFRYDSLQAELRRDYKNGILIGANYTYSKNITNGVGTAQARFEPYLDFYNQGLERARADFDQTHKINAIAGYQLPFGKGQRWFSDNAVADFIIGGWEMTGIFQLGSGAPITITDARGTLNRAGRSGRQTAVTNLTADELQALTGVFVTPTGIFFLNPSVLGRNPDGTLQVGRDGRGVSGNFDVAPFAGQVFFRNAPGTSSAMSRAMFNGPTYKNLDLTLIKRFNIGEKASVRVQADLFNALNSVNFVPSQFLDVNSVNFGKITSTTSPRIVQFGARIEF